MCPKRTRRKYMASLGLLGLGAVGGSMLATTDTAQSEQRQPARSNADYYVSTVGNDRNPGSGRQPFGTIERALAAMSPGDVTYVRGGTYRLNDLMLARDVHGTATAPIRLEGAPGERPVLRWQGGWSDWEPAGGLRLNDCSHCEFSNLELSHSPYKGIDFLNGTHHITLNDIDTHHHALSGVYISDSPDNSFRGVESHHNYDRPGSGENADGVSVIGNESRRNRFIGCRFHHNSDDGIDLYTSRGATLFGCSAYRNGRGQNGDGNGFKLGIGEGPSGDHTLRRCVAYSNRKRGFIWNNSEIPMRVYNCVAYDHDLVGYHFDESAHELRNNLAWKSGGVNIASAVDDEHNSWNLEIDDPNLESVDPVSPAFLGLANGSPCIDAGVDVGFPFSGSAPDLGAYEHNG